jgi:flagellar hook-length control protein FliK
VAHVASQASVLQSQQAGVSRRERTREAQDAASPFSILLTETASAPASTRYHSSRPNGSAASQRNEAPRSPVHRTDTRRPERQEERAADAAEAAEARTAGDAATGPSEPAVVAEPAAATPEQAAEPLDEASGETSNDEIVTADAALPATVEPPAAPAQPIAPDAPPVVTAAPAEAPATVATPAAPADTGVVEPAAVAPAGATAPITPDAVAGESEPAPAQAPQQPQAPQAPDHRAQQTNTPATPHAKPSIEAAVAAPEAAKTQQPPAMPEAAPAEAAAAPEQAEAKSAPKETAQADTPSQAPAQPNAPDAAERPQTGNTVKDVVQANQPTPDLSHLANLQSGRDLGQAAAATAAAPQSAGASNPLVSAPVPLESLAVEIASRAQGGRNRFEIRLDPPELGRIEVRLDIDKSGNVTSRLVVEKTETLDVLRRDAHQLERALQDAGLKTSDNSLQFSLRDQAFAGRHEQGGSDRQHVRIADPELPAAESAVTTYGLTLRGGSGVDIRV